MIRVTYNGTDYDCAKAIKGADYVHLMNEDGTLGVAFDGVTDFSGFSIIGDWTTPTPAGKSRVATVGDDNVIRPCDRRGSEIPIIQVGTDDLEAGVTPLDTGSIYLVYE